MAKHPDVTPHLKPVFRQEGIDQGNLGIHGDNDGRQGFGGKNVFQTQPYVLFRPCRFLHPAGIDFDPVKSHEPVVFQNPAMGDIGKKGFIEGGHIGDSVMSPTGKDIPDFFR